MVDVSNTPWFERKSSGPRDNSSIEFAWCQRFKTDSFHSQYLITDLPDAYGWETTHPRIEVPLLPQVLSHQSTCTDLFTSAKIHDLNIIYLRCFTRYFVQISLATNSTIKLCLESGFPWISPFFFIHHAVRLVQDVESLRQIMAKEATMRTTVKLMHHNWPRIGGAFSTPATYSAKRSLMYLSIHIGHKQVEKALKPTRSKHVKFHSITNCLQITRGI